MILILGYNNCEWKCLNDILDSNKFEYKYSLLESQIMKADKFILPDPLNFNSTYRKLNMMNLFSMLRMVNKPILGINNGFRLMCGQLLNESKCGLGFLPLELNISTNLEITEKFEKGLIGFKDKSKLLNEKYKGEEISFSLNYLPIVCEYSKAVISHQGLEYSLTYESDYYYGIDLNYELNPKICNDIIKNFAKLK